MPLPDLRRDYEGAPLDEGTADADPFRQFERWFDEAREQELDPTAMALSTVDGAGHPAVRMVLLKGLDARGFVFFTNYESRKGRELAGNPRASILFYWASLHRQVRIEGVTERVAAAESDAYFASRPPESRLAALASPQSQILDSRRALDERYARALERFPGAQMPRPQFWGGYRLIPDTIEFWQGRPSRLHDRLRYQRESDGLWARVRLAP
ncbi:MAG: pyridoxamine 5'-phosphate oxidase [Vicinamibacterales bacterium]